jgi:hypothetical protein
MKFIKLRIFSIALGLGILQTQLHVVLGQTNAWFNVDVENPKDQLNILQMEWFGGSVENPDNSAAFALAIRRCASLGGPCTVAFKPGVYHFTGREALYIAGMTDFILDGQGSTLMFSRPTFIRGTTSAPMIYIQNCLRCHFKNLVLDWDEEKWRLASIGILESATLSVWRFRILDWNVDLSKIWSFQSIHMVDPGTLNMGVANGAEYFFKDYPIRATLAGPCADNPNCTVLELNFERPFWKIPRSGVPWLLRHFSYDVAAFAVKTCTHCIWEGITWLGNPGKALTIGESSQFLTVRKSRMWKKPGRSITATADGIFIAKTRGNILLEDVELSWHGDDCFNVHNPIAANGLVQINANTVQVLNSPLWRTPFAVGDLIHTLGTNYKATGFIAKVAEASFEPNGDVWTLGLDRNIPIQWTSSQLKQMPIVNTRFVGSHVILRRVFCHSNRARGFLIQTPISVVEQCRIDNIQMACLAIRGSEDWGEGTGAHSVLVTQNELSNCDRTTISPDKGAFRIDGEIMDGTYRAGETLHRNITFSNNTIINMHGRVMELTAGRNFTIINNLIINSAQYPDTATQFVTGDTQEAVMGERVPPGAIILRQTRFTTITNNTWIQDSTPVIEAQPSAMDWLFQGNLLQIFDNGSFSTVPLPQLPLFSK